MGLFVKQEKAIDNFNKQTYCVQQTRSHETVIDTGLDHNRVNDNAHFAIADLTGE